MNLKTMRLSVTSMLLSAALIPLAAGCAGPAPSLTTAPPAIQPSTIDPAYAIDIKLSMPDFPTVGKPVPLITTLSITEGYTGDAPGTIVEVVLPKTFELVEGDLQRTVDVMRGAPVTFQITVKCIQYGGLIVVRATCSSGKTPCVGGFGDIHVSS